jgi:hypothetical protein
MPRPSEALAAYLKAYLKAVDEHGMDVAHACVFDEAEALDRAVHTMADRARFGLPATSDPLVPSERHASN